LLGSFFLVLTLIGLDVLAWAVLGLVMVWALTDIVLVAVGSSGPPGRFLDRQEPGTTSDEVMADPAIVGRVARVLATGPHRPSG
jgi:hypothetical protein